jgi:hypothetical protein
MRTRCNGPLMQRVKRAWWERVIGIGELHIATPRPLDPLVPGSRHPETVGVAHKPHAPVGFP